MGDRTLLIGAVLKSLCSAFGLKTLPVAERRHAGVPTWLVSILALTQMEKVWHVWTSSVICNFEGFLPFYIGIFAAGLSGPGKPFP